MPRFTDYVSTLQVIYSLPQDQGIEKVEDDLEKAARRILLKNSVPLHRVSVESMIRREGPNMQSRVYRSVVQRLDGAAGGTIRARRPMLRARLILCGLGLILAAGSWRPASTLAQIPVGTPILPQNAKWVTDRGSQVFNVKAYGATGNGTTDDTTAINAAKSAAGVGGTILFPPGNYLVSSQLQFTASYQVLSGYGANIICALSSATDCIMIGTVAGPAYAYSGISINGLQVSPGTNTSANSAIRDNGQDTYLTNVHGGISSGYSFLHFIEDDNDQGQIIDHLYNMSSIITCNSTTCGAALWGNPSNGAGNNNAGISYVQNSNFSSNCSANDIDWETGNHLTVSHSIFQAWSQYALRTNAPVDIDGWTHWEQGGCTNPLNDGNGHALGGAGLISLGGNITAEGSGVGGVNGSIFSTNASGGATTYAYWVVGHDASSHSTAPLVIGYLTNGGATIGGSAQNYLVWPALTATGVTNFDILRTGGGAPYGTGAYAVATAVTASSACGSNGVCAYTDAVGTPSSYAVAAENLYPIDTFWPGNLVVFSSATGNNYSVGGYSGPLISDLIVNTAPTDQVVVHVTFTGTGNYFPNGAPTGPGLITGGHPYSAYAPAPAELFPNGVPVSVPKGWVNFGAYGGYGSLIARDYITLADSNWAKTLADPFKRPSWDAADSAVCGDSAGACLRSSAVSQYIGLLPDSSHWATRTTSTGIADAVPHYGMQTISAGASNTPTLTDESSATTCAASTFYALHAVCFDGTNFELVIWAVAPGTSETGSGTASWAAVGSPTIWGNVTFLNLGPGSLAANTAYYFKTAGCTVGGCSTASSQATVTTANDGASHMVLLTGTAKAGHASYQVGCSTTTDTEALLTAPFTGAYTGAGYLLPVMGCSGSGSFNTADATATIVGNVSGSATGLTFGTTSIPTSATAPTNLQCLGYDGTSIVGTACGGSGGVSNILNVQGPLSPVQGTGGGVGLFSYSVPLGTLSVGQGIRFTAGLVHSTGSANVNYAAGGGVTYATYSSSGGSCQIVYTIMAATATTGTYSGAIKCQNGIYTTSGNIGSLNWASNAFGVSVSMTVASTDYVTPIQWLVEYIH